MGKPKITINFGRTEAVYYPGETVSGDVTIEVDEEIKTREVRIEMTGRADVHWTEGTGKYKEHHRSSEVYFSNRISLQKGNEDSFLLQPGHYQYQFMQTLPRQLPSSFEAYHGRVRYLAKVVIDRPWHIDDELGRAFTVISPLDLNCVPNAMIPQGAGNSKILCCCCCKTGPISATMKIERSGFVSGEKIAIHGECINNSNRLMDASRAVLWMAVTLHATTEDRRSHYPLATVERPQIRPGGSDFWQGEGVVVPPCPPSGLPGCRIIDIEYSVVFEIDPSGPSLDLEVSVPVVIGTIPLAQVVGSSPPLPPISYHPLEFMLIPPGISEVEGGDFLPLYPTYGWSPPEK